MKNRWTLRSFLGPTSNEVEPAAIYGFDPGPVKAMACKILLQFRPFFLLLAPLLLEEMKDQFLF